MVRSPRKTVERCAVALGSNLGDRIAFLRFGVARLRRLFDDLAVSGVYESAPMYETDQPSFLNACCAGYTRLTPLQLLAELQDAERAAGRSRGGPKYGPRELDLDLLLHGDAVLELPDLALPHPRMRERGFVLGPLAEIVPGWTVPGTGAAAGRTVRELAEAVDRTDLVRTEQSLVTP